MATPQGSTNRTKRLIAAYQEEASAPMFLSSKFSAPRRNFHNSAEVEVDIERDTEEAAVVVQDLTTGYNINANDQYQNRAVVPPVYKEAGTLQAHDLLKRNPGEDAFKNPEFRGTITLRVYRMMRKLERKIRRALEIQAAQILTTGQLILLDNEGVARYSLNFAPKATHFPTVAVAWSANNATPLEDLRKLAEVIRDDGLMLPTEVIMGENAFMWFVQNDEVQKVFDNRRISMGGIQPMQEREDGGQFRGVVESGVYRFDIWTYGGKWRNVAQNRSDYYVPTDRVIMRAPNARMDATFGGIPNIKRDLGLMDQGGVFSKLRLPTRFSSSAGAMDLHPAVWFSPDGTDLFAGIGSRPLLLPTAIDTFGCLDVNP